MLKNLDNNDQGEEIAACTILNWLYAVIFTGLDPYKDSSTQRILNRLNYDAHTSVRPLFDEGIKAGEVPPAITSHLRTKFTLPDSAYISDNASDYGMSFKDITKLRSDEQINKHHWRITITLMHYLDQQDKKGNFSASCFEKEILNHPKAKQKDLLKNLGNEKLYYQSLRKYKKVSHFILVSLLPLDVSPRYSNNNYSLKENLAGFLGWATYFRKKLLELRPSKNSKFNDFPFSEEDFLVPPLEEFPNNFSKMFGLYPKEKFNYYENLRKEIWSNLKQLLIQE